MYLILFRLFLQNNKQDEIITFTHIYQNHWIYGTGS